MFRVPAKTPVRSFSFGQARKFDIKANEDRQGRRCEDAGRDERDPGYPARIPGRGLWFGLFTLPCRASGGPSGAGRFSGVGKYC
jgi:hypothetical protein